MLNSIGLQGPGHRRRSSPTTCRGWQGSESSSGCRSAASRPRTSLPAASASTGRSGCPPIELNLSCPNVEEAPETAAELVAAARAATEKPLYAKLSPAQWDAAAAARAVVAAGADGLSLVNTIRGLALDPQTLRPRLARAVGGYSGPALKPIALACVHACASAVDVPIVGMGGVWTGLDALELVAAGAGAVGPGDRALRRSACAGTGQGRAGGRSGGPRARRSSRRASQLLLSRWKKSLQTAENGTA